MFRLLGRAFKLFSWKLTCRLFVWRMLGPDFQSACQKRNAWCTSCCGLGNLDLSPDDRAVLIEKRSAQMAAVDLRDPGAIAGFRQLRETEEERLPRHSDEIYVCPFLGRLESGGRLGCMIHPTRTGDPQSQRFSFYGAAICSSYDCRVKEEDDGSYADLLAELFPASEEYGRLVADHALFRALRKGPLVFERCAADQVTRGAFLAVCRARLRTDASLAMTSFELEHRYYADPAESLLALLENFGAAEEQAVAILLDTGPVTARRSQ